ncbi:MAG: c-type cytochrome, partial [Burkholderiales bacterium]
PDFARNAHGNIAEQNRIIGVAIGADTTRPAPTTLQPKPAAKSPASQEAKVAAVTDAKALPSVGPAASTVAATGSAVKPAATAAPAKPAAPAPKPVDVSVLLKANSCTACHGMTNKIVGPGFNEVATKYKGKSDVESYLAGKIKSGGSGTWGAIPMPAQAQLSDADAKAIARWIAAGAK